MGLGPKFSTGNYNFPNPDPYRFSTIRKEFVGSYAIAEIKYSSCTTFDGRKLLLLNTKEYVKPLDPHLLGKGHCVIARFEPNEQGWLLARKCAELLNKTS